MEKFFVAVKLVLCCSADSVNTNQCGVGLREGSGLWTRTNPTPQSRSLGLGRSGWREPSQPQRIEAAAREEEVTYHLRISGGGDRTKGLSRVGLAKGGSKGPGVVRSPGNCHASGCPGFTG